MFNFIGHLYFYSSEWLCRWDPSALLGPGVYNAVKTTGTRIPDPPFSSFGPSRDYGMDLCLEVYL